ncbi:MAG TPA: YicC family protein [Pyrinomonadaceae bacterium]|nr:YicC family protein [Pyrinomonadaceae bacterium]
MRSMTGFGRATITEDSASVTIELKTVNNRFLDVNLRLPSDLQHLENDIKRTITDRLARGRVEVNLQFDRSEDVSYELNKPMIAGYLEAMSQLRAEFGLEGEPDLNVIARLPNVVSVKRAEVSEDAGVLIQKTLAAAIDDLEAMRGKEGDMLAAVLESNLAEIERRLAVVASESANVSTEFQQRLEKRIGDLLAKAETQVELDPSRLAQEVAFLADRSDISEEIDRLGTHISHFRDVVKDTRDVGKRLDFLTQELNREANTIASKTQNMTVKENALAIKSEIEKIREQVQNIE